MNRTPGNQDSFATDVAELRRRAREHMDRGAVTSAYGLDPQQAIDILNVALATEIVCVLRYKHHYFMAVGIHAKSVSDEFLEHAQEEQEHADSIARRITQLGGSPDLDPANLAARSHAQYVPGGSLTDMIRENLIAERIAIESYADMIRFFGDRDITSRRLMESILETEEEHANELNDLLATLDPTKAAQPGPGQP